MGDMKSTSERLDKMQKEKQEAREEAKQRAKERDEARQELELLRNSVPSKSQKRSSLKGANSSPRSRGEETINTRSSIPSALSVPDRPAYIQGLRSPRQSPRKEPGSVLSQHSNETPSHRAMAETQKTASLAKALH